MSDYLQASVGGIDGGRWQVGVQPQSAQEVTSGGRWDIPTPGGSLTTTGSSTSYGVAIPESNQQGTTYWGTGKQTADSGIGSEGAPGFPAQASIKQLIPCNFPFSAKQFTGRDVVLQKIYNQTIAKRNTDGRRRRGSTVALYGYGGIGKTTVAIGHGDKYMTDYYHNGVFFVDCGKLDVLRVNFAKIGHLLKLEGVSENTVQENIVKVKQWLQEYDNWLLIFDNADEKDILQFLSSEDGYIPQGHRLPGDVIVTTRSDTSLQYIETEDNIEVAKFQPGESRDFLLKRASINNEVSYTSEELEAVERLVGLIDGVPLLLEQVASYMYENCCSFPEYLELVTHGDLRLSGVCFGPRGKTLANTYEPNFQKIEESDDAMTILIYASLLSNAKIPFSFFKNICHQTLLLDEESCKDMKKLLQKARSYSLMKFAPNRNGFIVHSVIQTELLRRKSNQEKETYALALLKAIHDLYQDAQIDDKIKRGMLTHTHSLMKKCWNLKENGGLLVLNRTPQLSIRLGLTLLKVAQTYATMGQFSTARKMILSVESEVVPELMENEGLAKYLMTEVECQSGLLSLWEGHTEDSQENATDSAVRHLAAACRNMEDASVSYKQRNDEDMRALVGDTRLELRRVEIYKWMAYVKMERFDTSSVEDLLQLAFSIIEKIDKSTLDKGQKQLRKRQEAHLQSMKGRLYKLLALKMSVFSPDGPDSRGKILQLRIDSQTEYWKSEYLCDSSDNRLPLYRSQIQEATLLLHLLQKPQEGRSLAQSSLKVFRNCETDLVKRLYCNDRYMCVMKRRIAWALFLMEKHEEALDEINAAVDIFTKAYQCREESYHTKLGVIRHLKGQILSAMGRFHEAKAELLKAKKIYLATSAEGNPNKQRLAADLFRCDEALGLEADDVMMGDTLVMKHHF